MRRDGVLFDSAFYQVMQGYNLDWGTTRREVGKILGRRNKGVRKKKKNPGDVFSFSGLSRSSLLHDASVCEQSLIAGLPADDL